MDIGLTGELSRILRYSRDEAMRTGYYGILPEHLLLGLLRQRENDACRVLEAMGIDTAMIKREVDARISRGWSVPFAEQDNITLAPEGNNALSLAVARARSEGLSEASSLHLLRSLLSSGSAVLETVLRECGLDAEDLSEWGAGSEVSDRADGLATDRGAEPAEPAHTPAPEPVHTFVFPCQTRPSGCS